MDPVSRFLSALAFASAPLAASSGTSAQSLDQLSALSEQELYSACLDGGAAACSVFLSRFPGSPLASQVIVHTIDRWDYRGGAAGPRSGEGGDDGGALIPIY